MPSAPFLRPWSLSDADALVGCRASDDELDRQLGGADLTTTDAARRYIERFLLDRDDRVHRAVVADDRVVGSIGLPASSIGTTQRGRRTGSPPTSAVEGSRGAASPRSPTSHSIEDRSGSSSGTA